MINYYIPDFVNKFNINIALLELINTKPEMFYDDFKIGAVFGNFPNCIWNGGRVWDGRFFRAEEQLVIAEKFNYYGVPLRLTMTNHLVEEKDLNDRYANYIMKNLDNGINQVTVASPLLEEYIRSEYPNYKIIKSVISANEEYYNDDEKYFCSVLKRSKNSDIEYLKSIKNKEKIELLVADFCVDSCSVSNDHYTDLAKIALYEDNCEQCLNGNCRIIPNSDVDYTFKRFLKAKDGITRNKIKNIYEPMGFEHFKIAGRGFDIMPIFYYAHYMVKPEYCFDFLYRIINESYEDFRRRIVH